MGDRASVVWFRVCVAALLVLSGGVQQNAFLMHVVLGLRQCTLACFLSPIYDGESLLRLRPHPMQKHKGDEVVAPAAKAKTDAKTAAEGKAAKVPAAKAGKAARGKAARGK